MNTSAGKHSSFGPAPFWNWKAVLLPGSKQFCESVVRASMEEVARSNKPELPGLQLLPWVHNQVFGFAKEEGWLDALAFYGFRDSRSQGYGARVTPDSRSLPETTRKRVWSSEKFLLSLRSHRITMVQPAESRRGMNLGFSLSANCCRPTCWRVLREPEMRPVLMVMSNPLWQDSAQMFFA